ncbi:pirin-like bicupin family protein [Pontibacter sp. SGAir0037]|uniref:pirin family protein n=1 Tax=Pontibacter sp. SGAir0037 TaxID=2571030 RepID=UPI0010CD3F90|nr:pirin-like bicupin family protein [Pontibacter sp. SGAir0037]QCR21766.1 pirin family protein [Pontibacter sp. SGAir0037]
MIKLITAAERHESKVGDWLRSKYLFSFADYYDPANVQFGPLRVFNDDIVAPNSGYPSHQQADMEMLVVVLDGTLTHKDSLGNQQEVAAGQVQRVTAGTGINTALSNETDKDVRVLQLWFIPNKEALAPSYEQMSLDFLDKKGKLIPLATGQKVLEDVVFLNSNSTVYYSKLGSGADIDFQTFKIRKTLIYVLDGRVVINGAEVDTGDHMRLEDQEIITLHADKDTSFILIDVPAVETNY